jgi:DNA-binding winged helix-turn-helix (wHTH) protein
MPKPNEIYEFGSFVLNISEHRLLCQGQAIHLPPKAFELLAALTRNSGHLMEKADLMGTVWPDTHVEEANLAQTVSVLRKALGVVAGGCLYIETVPKRGYRMVVAAKQITGEERTEPVSRKPASSLRVRSFLSLGALVGAALACILLYRSLTGH